MIDKTNKKENHIFFEIILALIDLIWFVLVLVVTSDFSYGPLYFGFVFVAVIAHLSYVFLILGYFQSNKTSDKTVPCGVDSCGAKVFLCKEFHEEDYFVDHLMKVFTLLMIPICMSVFVFLFIPYLFLSQLLIWGSIVGFCIWFAHMVDKCNFSRQSAFILYKGRLFYMRFGYSNTNPYENQSKNKHVRSIRRNPESYCEHLFLLMGQYESMADVVTFLELSNPRIDDQHGDWAWISYGVDDEENRSVIKVRNGYDWSMLDEVVGLPDGADPITGYKRIF